jgi:hypothetical protein
MSDRKAGFQAFILATILAAGFAAVWGLSAGWLMQAFNQFVQSPSAYEILSFRPDGTPVVAYFMGGNSSVRLYRDVAGNPIEVQEEKWLNPRPLPADMHATPHRGDAPWSQRILPLADSRRPPVYWFVVSNGQVPGSAYLVGYDSLSRGRVGFIGAAGFRNDDLPSDELFALSWDPSALRSRVQATQNPYATRYPFGGLYIPDLKPGDLRPWDIYLMSDDHSIYQIDLTKRTVRPAFGGASARSFALTAHYARLQPPSSSSSDHQVTRLTVRTDDKVVSLDHDDHVRDEFAIPQEIRDRDFNWGQTNSSDAIAYTWVDVGPWDARRQYTIYRCTPAGIVKQRQETILGQATTPVVWPLRPAVLAPSPLETDALVAVLAPLDLLSKGQASGYGQALAEACSHFAPSLVITHLIAALLAWLCYRRQARYCSKGSGMVLWPLFVFVCGLPGWVGYRYGRWWPALMRCPACGRIVPEVSEACEVCRTEFPMPGPKGIEVFA